MLYFSGLNFLSILSDLSLSRETNTQKKLSNFAKLQALKNKIYRCTKKNHLALGNLAKLVFLSILPMKNWSFAKLLSFFCLSFSHERKIWGNERISFSENPGYSPCSFISVIFYKVRSGFLKIIFWSAAINLYCKGHIIYFLPNFKVLKKQKGGWMFVGMHTKIMYIFF